jgi:rhodanese-related sulfurtransferase
MKNIDFYELQDIRSHIAADGEDEAVIVNVLSPEDFAVRHIPGSVNIPVNGNHRFAKDVQGVAGGKHRPVVVYCAGAGCPAAAEAARILEEAGFTAVNAYEGGMAEWQELDGGLESESEDDIVDDFGGRGINTPPLP